MKRHEQRKFAAVDHLKNMTASGQYTAAEAQIGAKGFYQGIEWADAHPILSKNTIEEFVNSIKMGVSRTLSEYSNNPELSKAFDAGQILALEILLEWIDYQEKGGEE